MKSPSKSLFKSRLLRPSSRLTDRLPEDPVGAVGTLPEGSARLRRGPAHDVAVALLLDLALALLLGEGEAAVARFPAED